MWSAVSLMQDKKKDKKKGKKKDKKKGGKKDDDDDDEDAAKVSIVTAAVGGARSAAVSNDGKLYAWGAKLHPEVDASDVPVVVEAFKDKPVKAVALGEDHAVIVLEGASRCRCCVGCVGCVCGWGA